MHVTKKAIFVSINL